MLPVFNMPLFSIWYRCIGDCMAFLLLVFCVLTRKKIHLHTSCFTSRKQISNQSTLLCTFYSFDFLFNRRCTNTQCCDVKLVVPSCRGAFTYTYYTFSIFPIYSAITFCVTSKIDLYFTNYN